jgi:hypothetical protein
MLNCLNGDLNSDNLTVEVSVCIPSTGAAGAGIDYRIFFLAK